METARPPGVNPVAGARRQAARIRLETCFAPCTVSRGPAAASGMADVPLALDAVRILVMVVVLITVPWPSRIQAREPSA